MRCSNLAVIVMCFGVGCSKSELPNATGTAVEAAPSASKSEGFAKAVVDTLVRNDRSTFEGMLTTDYRAVAEVILADQKRRADARKDAIVDEAMLKNVEAAIKNKLVGSWDAVRAEGIKRGIDWGSVVVSEIRFEKPNIIAGENLEVIISAGGKSYELRIGDLTMFDGKWFCSRLKLSDL